MLPVSISDAKNAFSALIQKVRRGETILITDRGVPVAQIVPLVPTKGLSSASIELARRGLLKLPEVAPAIAWDKGLVPAARLSRGKSAVDELIQQRRSGK